MDFSDFLIEYDLTPEQRKLAARLKAEANLKQLLNSLADHALFFSAELATTRAPARVRAKTSVGGGAAAQRGAVLAWFSSLDVPQRVSLLTCEDATWVRVALRMSCLRGSLKAPEGRFRIVVKAAGPAPRGRGSEGRARVALAPREPSVHYRRPHRLPDGELLVPPARSGHREACAALLRGLRVAFKGCCCTSLAFDWGAVMASPALVSDVDEFAQLLDAVSLGKFLQDIPVEPTRASVTSWDEAPWLHQWGSHFPLAAFLGSRLEVLLLQGYAARDSQVIQRHIHLPLADVWAAMSPAQRETRLRRVGSSLLRRVLSETLATTFSDHDGSWVPPCGLAALFADHTERQDRAGTGAEPPHLDRQAPLELVGSATTVALHVATSALDATMNDVLLKSPKMWLHQQFAEELAIACSEFSASALLDTGGDKDGALAPSKRSSKKQRQKLRRRLVEEESTRKREAEEEIVRRHSEAIAIVRDLLVEVLDMVWEEVAKSDVEDQLPELERCDNSADLAEQEQMRSVPGMTIPSPLASAMQGACAGGPPGTLPGSPGSGALPASLPEPTALPKAFAAPEALLPPAHQEHGVQASGGPHGGGRLDDWGDGRSSELSSIGVATTSRSNSVSEIGLGHALRHRAHYSLLERSYWDNELLRARRRVGRAARMWHDDSRLEFLLRNRDRFATELEWDRMSQGSVPASLDEAALYPVGLETRFAYLFDSPPRSHVTTALASQATAEDDADRVRSQWEDFEEWRSLTQALETTQGEREMWKAKAQELEGYLALHNQQFNPQLMPQLNPHLTPQATPLVRQSSSCSAGCSAEEVAALSSHNTDVSNNSADRTPPQVLVDRRPKRMPSNNACGDAPSALLAWRYLVLLVLAQLETEAQREAQELVLLASDDDLEPEDHGPAMRGRVERSYSTPRLGRPGLMAVASQEDSVAGLSDRLLVPPEIETLGDDVADESQLELDGIGDALAPDCDSLSTPPMRGLDSRKRALHVTFGTRYKRHLCERATQTAPAITLSKMYGGMVPRYIQRELARLRHENQLLRFRVTSLAMSQPIGRPRPIRHQGTQTAPAITFSTSRQQGSGPTVSSIPRLPREISRLEQVSQQLASYPAVFEPSWFPSECMRSMLEESIHAFVRTVESQTQSQSAYRCAIQGLCRRAAKMLWPRSTVELYGSFASGLALPSSGLDLVIYPHRHELHQLVEDTDEISPALSPIDEDVDQLRQLPLDEVSPGHPSSVPRLSSGWQQQLSCRLAQEKWVLSDSIRITAHAAIPTLSFITAPEEAASSIRSEVEPLSCPIRVDVSLEDPNHRGLRSKAIINLLLNEFPVARPVTLVLKQWLIERTYGMSHTGGLCSYGLLLMVVGFLQQSPTSSPAAALLGCLRFYGRRFDPQLYGVSVARGAFLHRRSPLTWPPPQAEYVDRGLCPGVAEFASLSQRFSLTGEWAHRFDPLWIEDPLNPTNNVGRNCFRVRQIQRSLALAADALIANEAGSTLRAILRVDGHGHGVPPEGEEAAAPWRGPLRSARALHEDLYQSLVEHAPSLMLPLPAHSHLPQQWDSVVRYAARPGPGPRRSC